MFVIRARDRFVNCEIDKVHDISAHERVDMLDGWRVFCFDRGLFIMEKLFRKCVVSVKRAATRMMHFSGIEHHDIADSLCFPFGQDSGF